MKTSTATQLGVAVVASLVALQLAGCASTIKPEGAAQSVVDLVSSKTSFKPTDVSCPSGVDATVGQEFDCHFTGPKGTPYTAHMKITKVNGDNVEFDIQTKPT